MEAVRGRWTQEWSGQMGLKDNWRTTSYAGLSGRADCVKKETNYNKTTLLHDRKCYKRNENGSCMRGGYRSSTDVVQLTRANSPMNIVDMMGIIHNFCYIFCLNYEHNQFLNNFLEIWMFKFISYLFSLLNFWLG